jgi:serine protease Do
VVVTAVEPDGPAAEQGLQTGNVILEVGGNPVGNAGDVRLGAERGQVAGQASNLDAREDGRCHAVCRTTTW